MFIIVSVNVLRQICETEHSVLEPYFRGPPMKVKMLIAENITPW